MITFNLILIFIKIPFKNLPNFKSIPILCHPQKLPIKKQKTVAKKPQVTTIITMSLYE